MAPSDHAVLAKAIRIAAIAHGEQLDKCGRPYILHPIRVLQRCELHPLDVQVVAILHDVVEDTHLTLDDLRAEGFNQKVIEGVDAMSKREGEDFFDYVRRCSESPVGCIVKLADMQDNSDPIRKFQGDPERLVRYAKARQIVEEAMRQRGQL
jgi:(p)ppGpp synthase/HD superfamily hydrolase